MIYLLLGKDDFSKREFFSGLRAAKPVEVLQFEGVGSEKEIMRAASELSLFSQPKLLKILNFMSGVNEDFNLDSFIASLAASTAQGNTFVFIEDALDKRKKQSKAILADKRITAKEFNVPGGADFKKWVEQRAAGYKLSFAPRALDALLTRLGVGQGSFGDELYSLWQADSDLQKLAAFAGGKPVGVADVEALVSENVDDDIFAVTNAIADRNHQAAVAALVNYMDRMPGSDEKAKVISVSGVLAEQFRGVLAVQGLAAARVSDAAIAAQTGYSSGKIFMYKKISQRFDQKKLVQALQKLEILDQEIKTGNSPAALQFFMVVQSAMA